MESIAGYGLLGLGKQGLAMTNQDGAHCDALIDSCLKTFHVKHRGNAIQQDGCFIDRVRVTKRGKCAQHAVMTDHRNFDALAIRQSHDDRDDAPVRHVDLFERLTDLEQRFGLPKLHSAEMRANQFKIFCG